MTIKNLFTIGLLSLLLISCGSESEVESTTEKTTGKIIFQVSTTSNTTGSPNGRVLAANDLQFTSGTITIREVVFDASSGDQSISRTIEQIADIDYATGDVTPQIVVDVPPGDYTSVYLGIEMQDDGDDPSTVIEGTYINSDEESIPIRFEFNSGEVFEAEADQVTIEAGTDIVGKITFDAISWFSTVSIEDLDNARLTDGVMIISETSNEDIFDIVADKLDVDTEAVFE